VKLRFSQLLCVLILGGAFLVISDGYAQTQTGLASYYGPELAGQPTASGEPFNPYGFTAAHRTLPLGTKLIVSYGGRSVEVTVNDRGPYSGGRDLDLSQGAADYLGLTYAGVDYVDYTVVGGYGAGGYSGGGGASTYTGTDGLSQAPAAHFSSNGQSGTYVVQAGDTLYGISAELGTTVDHLVATNGIEDPNLLYVGDTLRF
jgi:peptidoglycan lytic transglycosylase